MSKPLGSSVNAFVGRARELAELSAGIEHGLDGRGQLFLLAGEPGIGKTRLAGEAATLAAARGMRVFWGRCWEGGGAPTYWPWAQIIRACVRDRDLEQLRAELGPGAGDVAQIVPEVRARLPEAAAPSPLEGEQARFRLFDSISAFFGRVAATSASLFVLEDLHWADQASLLLLRFLAREMGDVRLLVVGTYRDVEVRRGDLLADTLGALRREAVHHRIVLRGLPETEVRELLAGLGSAAVPEPLIQAIARQSEGNPFFIQEIHQSLLDEGSLGREHGRWTDRVSPDAVRIPDSVREVVSLRLTHLSPDCNAVLTTASVVGREFDLDVLAKLSELPSERLAELLEEAAGASVIHESPRGPRRYGFAHTLIRETLHGELRSSHRSQLHRRLADVLEHLYRRDPESHLTELAYHFFEAAHGGGDLDRAIAYVERAARRAAELFAYEEAAAQYERALELLDLAGAEDPRRCDVLLALGEAHRRAGQAEAAEAAFRLAAETAKRCGAADKLALAALGYAGKWAFRTKMSEPAVRLLEDALAMVGDADSAIRAVLLARLAGELVHQRPLWQRRAALAAESVDIARRVGDSSALAYALFRFYAARPWGDWTRTLLTDITADGDEMSRLSHTGDDELVHLADMWRMEEALRHGRIDETDAHLDAATHRAKERRQHFFLWWTSVMRASRAILDGRFEEGERLSLEAVAMGRRMQIAGAGVAFGGQTFILRWQQGRLDELEGPLQQTVARHPEAPSPRCNLAFLHTEIGRGREAQRVVDELGSSDLTAIDWGNSISGPVWLAEACAALGDAHHAATLYPALAAYPWPILASGTVLECLGASGRVLGNLAATMSHWDDAERHFEQALEIHARVRARPFLARTQLDYAKMLAARDHAGDRERARELLARAHLVAREIGMGGVLARVVALQERVGPAEPPRPSSAATSDPNVLRQEGDTWIIAYDGASFRLRDSKGLRYIAHLVGHPGREFHVADLLAVVNPDAGDGDEAIRPATLTHAGELLDVRARAEYRRRVDELREELAQADEWRDIGRASQVRDEIEYLTQELAGAYGLGGRARRAVDGVERLRKAVTGRIRDSIARIQRESPALALHLTNALRLGTLCMYTPEKAIAWTL